MRARFCAAALALCAAMCGVMCCAMSAEAHAEGRGRDRVLGGVGLAPALPEDVPGLDRPFPQDDEKFTFAVIGDKTGGGQENWHIFDRAMDEVNELRPDFALIVGDLIQGGTTSVMQLEREWKEFLGHAGAVEVPFFFLPGNHDIGNRVMYDYWEEHVGRTYYAFHYKGCHFIALNTEEGWRSNETMFGARQLEWLEKEIAERRDSKHIFVFMHRPAWRHSGEALEQWERIEGWLSGTRYTVFVGHYHRLSYEPRHDRPYFIMGPTGAALNPSEVEELGAMHHYALVTVDGAEAHVAIVRPGSVFPHDIATPEFRKLVGGALRIERVVGKDALRLSAKNPFEKTLRASLSLTLSSDGSSSTSASHLDLELEPGKASVTILEAPSEDAAGGKLSFKARLSYDGELLYERTGELE